MFPLRRASIDIFSKYARVLTGLKACYSDSPIILETAVGPRLKVQDFELESVNAGGDIPKW